MIWDFFDEIFCINLYSRNDRLIQSSKRFKELNIPITYHRVNKHPVSGEIGCFESHLEIINYAYEKQYNNILIFEDDFISSPYYNIKLIEEAIDFMERNTTWEIFYFGHQTDILWKSTSVISPNIIKTFSTLNHSYAISKRFIEKMYKKKYEGLSLDKIFLKNNNSYALYPMAFYQDETDSDIPTSKPIRYMRFIEIYARYINCSIIELIFLFIFIIIVIILIVKFI